MSDKQNPTVAALRDAFASPEVWKTLTEAQQNIIKQTASDIDTMAATVAQQEEALEKNAETKIGVSADVYLVDPNTKANVRFMVWGITGDSVERQMVDFISRTTGQQTAARWLTQDAYRDANWGNKGGDKQAQPQQKNLSGGKDELPVHESPATMGNGGGQATETFNADELVGSTAKGKDYWKIQGGRYKQWGVNIWPEVLEASGFDVNILNPKETYPLDGWLAEITFKDDGKTDKVIKLYKVE